MSLSRSPVCAARLCASGLSGPCQSPMYLRRVQFAFLHVAVAHVLCAGVQFAFLRVAVTYAHAGVQFAFLHVAVAHTLCARS